MMDTNQDFRLISRTLFSSITRKSGRLKKMRQHLMTTLLFDYEPCTAPVFFIAHIFLVQISTEYPISLLSIRRNLRLVVKIYHPYTCPILSIIYLLEYLPYYTNCCRSTGISSQSFGPAACRPTPVMNKYSIIPMSP